MEEQIRREKVRKLRELGIEPYPHKFEVTHEIHNIREKYEKEPQGEEVVLKTKIKRISNYEGKKLLRLTDESGLEILALTEEEGLQSGLEYTFKGNLVRHEGKLTVINAKVVDEKPTTTIEEIKKAYDFDPKGEEVSLAGRLVAWRPMGKAIFGHIQDLLGKIQIYIKRDNVGKENFKLIKEFIDLGDIVGIKGNLFRTQTGELTVEVKELKLLSKCLHPLPEKWHGIKDVEVRYRQRYLDLIANPNARKIFLMRSKLLAEIRKFMTEKGFLEVETPILQPIASGANAKPFITHHNYLDMDLYLRIAPELYLKRLIVGGYPKVFEIGKNFRNEGVDTTHNPEFTMMEFYAAYWDYKDLIKFTERLFEYLINTVLGGKSKVTFEGMEIDLKPPFRVVKYFDLLKEGTGKDKDFFLKAEKEELVKLARELEVKNPEALTRAKLIDKIFEKVAEPKLVQPTFVIDFPKILSPLAKTHREDPDLVERFELIIGKMEVANAYTELNDPKEQEERFLDQLKEKQAGDDEAMEMDKDFIRALEYGLPPTGGEGIGIDRLAMLFAGVNSIREVILFPAMRPEG
ncbi:MAG TPA: lysine--tRNA ligase [Aquifex aeolicus]|uniref:Lysine--tRNA ligase n=1 Tax=Aquifex aeolicus TaxID=63363 RepID=A0A9D0YPC2_AQUAO|nr:lysine--tRNA ligase [Aquificales bacterium]HIP97865.1 lysine--tRNA ligase [Aquifex aeolicus]HIQ26213.1 lysine--tRNA ligase [Aquifex aeolicus]